MPDPIVIELQRLASDGTCPVDELLRKALLVATKLGVQDFRDWVMRELNGYDDASHIPDYRHATGDLRVFNPVQGRYMPYHLPPDLEEKVTAVPMAQPLGSLAQLATSDSTEFQVSISPGLKDALIRGQDSHFPMEPVLHISRVYVVRVLDAVRNTILDWSLRLEQQGILGEQMRFSAEEKAIAMSSPNIHIGSFQGVLGNVTDSTVTQNQQMTVAAGDFDSLKRALRDVGISDSDLDHLRTALQCDPKPQSATSLGPKVSEWIGMMMSKAASGAWKVTLETVGKLLPAAIAAYYGLNG